MVDNPGNTENSLCSGVRAGGPAKQMDSGESHDACTSPSPKPSVSATWRDVPTDDGNRVSGTVQQTRQPAPATEEPAPATHREHDVTKFDMIAFWEE